MVFVVVERSFGIKSGRLSENNEFENPGRRGVPAEDVDVLRMPVYNSDSAVEIVSSCLDCLQQS